MKIIITQTSIGTFKTFTSDTFAELDKITEKDNLKELGDYGHHLVLQSLKGYTNNMGETETETKFALRIIGATVGIIKVNEALEITKAEYFCGKEMQRIIKKELIEKGKDFFEKSFLNKKIQIIYKENKINNEKELLEQSIYQDKLVKNLSM